MAKFVPLILLLALCAGLFVSLNVVQQRQKPVIQEINLPLPEQITGLPRGSAFAINIFASWCAPCRVEAPLVDQLGKSGVTLIGINLRDEPAAAQKFLNDFGNPFKMIIADESGRLLMQLGATGIPETILIDAKGIMRYRFAGPITQQALNQEILPAWEKIK